MPLLWLYFIDGSVSRNKEYSDIQCIKPLQSIWTLLINLRFYSLYNISHALRKFSFVHIRRIFWQTVVFALYYCVLSIRIFVI